MRKNEQADPQEDKQEGGKQAHELYGSPFRHTHVSPLPVDDHPGCGKQIPILTPLERRVFLSVQGQRIRLVDGILDELKKEE